MRWPGSFIWPAAAVFAVGCELLALPGTSRGVAAADLAAGATILFAGLVGWRLRPESLVGPVLAAAGVAWFAGSLATSDIAVLSSIGSLALTLHRGPLVHAVLTYPGGRVRGRFDRAVVVVAYLYATVAAVGESRFATAAVVVLLLIAVGRGWAMSRVPERRVRRVNVAAAAVLAVALGLVAAPGLAEAMGLGPPMILRVYEFLLAALAVGLVCALVRGPSTEGAVADLVVELGGGADAGTLQGRLARALGDPSLEVGYWLEESSSYVDERGRRLVLPVSGSGRQVTEIERDGWRLAVMIHEASALADPIFVEGVSAAVRMAVSNVRLRVEIREQLEAITTSRRRIVAAGDAQRRRLEQEFRHGPERRLAQVKRTLSQARAAASAQGRDSLTEELEDAEADLVSAGEELRRFANGIHPATLTELGLAAALALLVLRTPVPVQLDCTPEQLPAPVEAAAYFVCSEGLANLAKHAEASQAVVTISCMAGSAVISVRDDGVGGADPGAGSGLRGLVDRVEALGGTLRVDSVRGGGTLLVAELPLTQ